MLTLIKKMAGLGFEKKNQILKLFDELFDKNVYCQRYKNVKIFFIFNMA